MIAIVWRLVLVEGAVRVDLAEWRQAHQPYKTRCRAVARRHLEHLDPPAELGHRGDLDGGPTV